MASVSFRNIEKSYGSTKVIHGIGFDIADGEFTVLVGPSGCGKSTLLRMLAGLEEISGGTIAIDNKVVNDMESKDRDIAMVFQSYALYPHMTVSDNMGFSLRLRKADPALTAQRVAQAAKILNLDAYLHRYPRELSGGQQQRVGVARALGAEPKIVLMDEPFGALDPVTRDTLAQDYRRLHDTLGLTTVMITHDTLEAVLIADRILVLEAGRIVADGTPHALMTFDESDYVRDLMQTPRRQAERLQSLLDRRAAR
jgi:multiple sugar transport system ATP-binding protein